MKFDINKCYKCPYGKQDKLFLKEWRCYKVKMPTMEDEMLEDIDRDIFRQLGVELPPRTRLTNIISDGFTPPEDCPNLLEFILE